jgi:nickel superoxide dismutase
MKHIALASLTVLALVSYSLPAEAHCQIPCGIYDDELRVQLIEEHIGTVEKSMKKIAEIGAADTVDHNQLVRWVGNKEAHAQEIQDIVTAYFMAQRIKPPKDHSDENAVHEYMHKLALLHGIQIHAMKAKQSTDLTQIETMRELTGTFRAAYFGEGGAHKH